MVLKNAEAIRGKTFVRIVVGDKDGPLERNRSYHELHVIEGVAHSGASLYDGLGDRNWRYFTRAFGSARKRVL